MSDDVCRALLEGVGPLAPILAAVLAYELGALPAHSRPDDRRRDAPRLLGLDQLDPAHPDSGRLSPLVREGWVQRCGVSDGT